MHINKKSFCFPLHISGNNVIIYPGAMVIGNILVGDNAIIAPNAVVNKDVPANSVVGGVPASVISADSSNVVGPEWHNYLYGYGN